MYFQFFDIKQHAVEAFQNSSLKRRKRRPVTYVRGAAQKIRFTQEPFIWLILLLALTTGCSTPSAKVERSWWKPWTWRADSTKDARSATEAKAKAAEAITANNEQLVQAAAAKVAATGVALDARTNREPATDLAAKFNQQASVLLPAPTVAELNELRSIVGGLLSTNAAERAAATDRLSVKEKELAELQRSTGELKAKLDHAEKSHAAATAKLQEEYVGERKVADQWRQHQAKTWLTRLVDLLGTGGMIALAVMVPTAAPLAGRMFGFMSRVMPSTSVLTGVVSKSGFDNVVAGVERVTAAVKQKDPKLADEALSLLRQEQSPEDELLVNACREAVIARRKSVRQSRTTSHARR